MNKSVLVIDTPESCWMCPIATDHSASEVSVYCPVIGKYITGKDCESVSEHCPLRPLPEHKEINETFRWGDRLPSFKCGWNWCLKAVVGEK